MYTDVMESIKSDQIESLIAGRRPLRAHGPTGPRPPDAEQLRDEHGQLLDALRAALVVEHAAVNSRLRLPPYISNHLV